MDAPVRLSGHCTASWELVAPSSEHAPTARAAATLSPVSLSDSAHPGGLFLFGGSDGAVYRYDIWRFDTRTAAWTMLLPHTAQAADASVRPSGRAGHSAITHNSNSEVVIFGSNTPGCLFNDVLSFSVRKRQWTRHECAGASPSLRAYHTACRVVESMYVFGGIAQGVSRNDLWAYALDAHAWTQVVGAGGSATFPRCYHSAIPLGNRLVVYGGNTGFHDGRAPHCFDLQRRRWSSLACEACHHAGASATRRFRAEAVSSSSAGAAMMAGASTIFPAARVAVIRSALTAKVLRER